MSKRRNVVFTKPGEPSFLKKLKNEIGFKEGPSIDTKRETLPTNEDDGDNEQLEEQPQIVVLKPGDLNAEEVETEKRRLDAEKNSRPANLNDRVIFRSTKKDSNTKEKPKATLTLLSFNVDEEDVTE